jgi:hypothetical protein
MALVAYILTYSYTAEEKMMGELVHLRNMTVQEKTEVYNQQSPKRIIWLV